MSNSRLIRVLLIGGDGQRCCKSPSKVTLLWTSHQTSYRFQRQILRFFYWNVWETLPPAATTSKQVSSLKPRERAKPWVCSYGWQVNVAKVICDLLSCYMVSLGVSLWQGLMSDNLALRFPLLRAVPWKSSLSGLKVLELEKTKGSCWQRSTEKIKKKKKKKKGQIELLPSVITQLWHEHVSPEIKLRSLGSVVFGSVGTWGAT